MFLCLNVSYIPYSSLKVVYQSKNRLFRVFQVKDKIADCKLSLHLVHKFLCRSCNTTYYGQTQRHTFVRACEHLAITLFTGKPVKTLQKTSIFDHMLFEGLRSSFDNFSILLKENNGFKLKLKESLLIFCE